jgi:hypothetical protein
MTNYGKWFPVQICKACHEPLSDDTIHNSQGVCPECGEYSQGQKTISTNMVILREVSTGFFRGNVRYEAKDKDIRSEAWLEKFGHQLKYML